MERDQVLCLLFRAKKSPHPPAPAAPQPRIEEAFGWYYSVEVKAMTSRIWGGLAVGVTQIRSSAASKDQ